LALEPELPVERLVWPFCTATVFRPTQSRMMPARDAMDPVIHFEVPAQDMERARRFYSRALGWNILPAYESYYFAVTTDIGEDRVPLQPGRINGGLQRKDDA
jgi:hypothetical protein